MRLAVASLDDVLGAILRWGPDAVVSAHSPGRDVEIPCTGPHLRLRFHDAEGGRPRAPGVAHTGRPLVLPEPAHVQALLAFIDAHSHGRILIHCAAGLGRSPALAILALVAQGIDAFDAYAMVREAVTHASPNRLLLAHGTSLLRQAVGDAAAATFVVRRGRSGARGSPRGGCGGSGGDGPSLQGGRASGLANRRRRVGRPENGVRRAWEWRHGGGFRPR